MKYSVLKVSNGNFFIESEWSDLTSAKVRFHSVCMAMWNAPDVITAEIMIADEQLNCVEGYREYIHHEAPEPEPEPATDVETEETE